MGLVSSIYRLAPPAGYLSKDEAERRLRIRMRRLVSRYGEAEVVRRLRLAEVPQAMELARAWMVLTAMAEGRRP